MLQKRPNLPRLLAIALTIFLQHCSNQNESVDDAYLHRIEAWQESRNVEMRDTSKSWLSLVGLHWLEQGESTFGADSTNAIPFPKSAPAFAGTFFLTDSTLLLKPAQGAQIIHEGKVIEEMEMRHDMDEGTTYLQMGSINFHAIWRPEGMAIRVKDSQSSALLAFKDIPNFTIDPAWKVEARLDWFETPRSIMIPTILGSERKQKCPALLVFELGGTSYQLSPYESFYGDPVWTIIFSDETNDETTYGGGRFLSIDAPEAGTQSIMLDFNQAYNPPCAFSAFATCPLPPPENRLAVGIAAGEMLYGAAH